MIKQSDVMIRIEDFLEQRRFHLKHGPPCGDCPSGLDGPFCYGMIIADPEKYEIRKI